MLQLSTSQARVIDPILSTVAQGYKNAELIGFNLFPVVPVGTRGGKIISFGKEDFALYNTARAPGANTKRVQFGYSGSSFSLESHSLEGQVPFELMQEAQAVPGIAQGSVAVYKTQNIILNRLEYAQAILATTAGNYAASNKTTLAGTSQWSDLTGGVSDPVKDIEVAKEAVRKQIGRRPNTIVMGAAVFSMLKMHPKVVDRMKYTGRDVATPELLAALFGVARVVIGEAVYTDGAGVMQDMWGKAVVVAYTDMSGVADAGSPTFGYTYRLSGYPLVESPYAERNSKSWIYPVTDEVAPVIAGASAGYLISAAVA
jgi:hypothetical protein